MFGTRFARSSTSSGGSRAGASAAFALCFAFALASGDARAHCLDFGGECSPSTAIPIGPCHEQTPADGADSGCSSCVDILVPEAAAVCGSRPDHDLRAPVASSPPDSAIVATNPGNAIAASPAHPISGSPRLPFQLTLVLRI
jgi:hypothetical protein